MFLAYFVTIISTMNQQVHKDFQHSRNLRQSIVNGLESLIQLVNNQQSNEGGKHHGQSRSFHMQHEHENIDEATKTNVRESYVIRSLNQIEINLLSTVCMCQCDDWSNVYLMYNHNELDENSMSIQKMIKEQVRNCCFQGYLLLGLSTRTTDNNKNDKSVLSKALKPAIVNNTLIKDSIISPGARVYGNTVISNTFIGPNASVINCNSISNERKDTDVMEITLGPESGGGRHVNVHPESTLVDVCDAMGISTNQDSNDDGQPMNLQPISLYHNFILGHIQSVHVGSNLFISEDASIESCPTVQGVILLPQSQIKNSTIESVFMQWKSSIVDSTVTSTLLMECSDIGPKSIVASTIIGPDSHVSCGEVHCSLIGPNTNSHHQSLLISVLWPMGRGNVGYGSNIGSNHTGRLPDQECTSGEGVFWGLGCVIKFPVDLSHAYYSVVAAGVQLPPQSVAMPFSLIMNGSSSSGGKNEIVPGWLLQSSPYTVLRSENKFKKRRKAKRHDFYTGWKIIRPGVIDACWNARQSLLQLGSGDGQNFTSTVVYSKSDILALGENLMTARGRKVGIESYTNVIQRYALHGLFEEMNRILSEGHNMEEKIRKVCTLWQPKHFEYSQTPTQKSWPTMPWKEKYYNDSEKTIEHQLSTLAREMPSLIGSNGAHMTQVEILQTLLKIAMNLEIDFFRRVKKSKARDDKRGSEIIPDYNNSHVLAPQDPVIKMAEEDTKEMVVKCNEILAILASFRSTDNTLHSKL